MSSFNGLSAIAVEMKPKEKFRTSAMLFYIQPKVTVIKAA
jgi:hypothetical protein